MARVTIEDSLLVAKTRFGLVSLASKRKQGIGTVTDIGDCSSVVGQIEGWCSQHRLSIALR